MIFLDACLGKKTPRPPVWIMRQAGRYLPEYREIRAKHSFLEMCGDPRVVREITLQPIRRFDMDAAIIFSDILLPLVPMGLDLSYRAGEGPVIANPVRSLADVRALKTPDLVRELDYVGEALRLTRAELDPSKALIGFAGAPFTLACYAVQGKGGGAFEVVRHWMFREPSVFDALLAKLAEMTIEHLCFQAESGAQALQLFDTWGGLLSDDDYRRRVFPHVQRIMDGLAGLNVPRILFVKNAGHFRDFLGDAGAEVIGLDWTMPLAQSREILGSSIAVQGNLDPTILFGSPELVRERTRSMLTTNGGRPGYIANLGHGIHKETPIENVAIFVETIKEFTGNHP